jgi:hypothetical protein
MNSRSKIRVIQCTSALGPGGSTIRNDATTVLSNSRGSRNHHGEAAVYEEMMPSTNTMPFSLRPSVFQKRSTSSVSP